MKKLFCVILAFALLLVSAAAAILDSCQKASAKNCDTHALPPSLG